MRRRQNNFFLFDVVNVREGIYKMSWMICASIGMCGCSKMCLARYLGSDMSNLWTLLYRNRKSQHDAKFHNLWLETRLSVKSTLPPGEMKKIILFCLDISKSKRRLTKKSGFCRDGQKKMSWFNERWVISSLNSPPLLLYLTPFLMYM